MPMCFQEFQVLYEGNSFRLEYVSQITQMYQVIINCCFINLYKLGVSVAHYYTCANKCGLDLCACPRLVLVLMFLCIIQKSTLHVSIFVCKLALWLLGFWLFILVFPG